MTTVGIGIEFYRRFLPTKAIHHLALGDHVEPRGKGILRIEIVDFQADFEKHLLADIVHLGGYAAAGTDITIQQINVTVDQFIVGIHLATSPKESEFIVAMVSHEGWGIIDLTARRSTVRVGLVLFGGRPDLHYHAVEQTLHIRLFEIHSDYHGGVLGFTNERRNHRIRIQAV